jgi:hypothetical protein
MRMVASSWWRSTTHHPYMPLPTLCAPQVRMWAKLDDLRIDNENSVALVLTHWWSSHYPCPAGAGGGGAAVSAPVGPGGVVQATSTGGAAGTAVATGQVKVPVKVETAAAAAASAAHQQGALLPGVLPIATAAGGGGGGGGSKEDEAMAAMRAALTASLRVNQLSPSFFAAVLPHLPWFAPTAEAWTMLCVCRALQVRGWVGVWRAAGRWRSVLGWGSHSDSSAQAPHVNPGGVTLSLAPGPERLCLLQAVSATPSCACQS